MASAVCFGATCFSLQKVVVVVFALLCEWDEYGGAGQDCLWADCSGRLSSLLRECPHSWATVLRASEDAHTRGVSKGNFPSSQTLSFTFKVIHNIGLWHSYFLNLKVCFWVFLALKFHRLRGENKWGFSFTIYYKTPLKITNVAFLLFTSLKVSEKNISAVAHQPF